MTGSISALPPNSVREPATHCQDSLASCAHNILLVLVFRNVLHENGGVKCAPASLLVPACGRQSSETQKRGRSSEMRNYARSSVCARNLEVCREITGFESRPAVCNALRHMFAELSLHRHDDDRRTHRFGLISAFPRSSVPLPHPFSLRSIFNFAKLDKL